MSEDMRLLAAVYEESLRQNGAVPQGVLWPNAADLAKRFQVLLEPALEAAAETGTVSLLDFGCGPGLMLDFLAENGMAATLDYTGVDMLQPMVDAARRRWPQARFDVRDVRQAPFAPDSFDFVVACGAFTAKFGLGHEDMAGLVTGTLEALWPSVRRALAFNVMSKHVDWERQDLFHWPLDDIAAFCKAKLSRHLCFRTDYGLWETTVIVRREPEPLRYVAPAVWTGAR